MMKNIYHSQKAQLCESYFCKCINDNCYYKCIAIWIDQISIEKCDDNNKIIYNNLSANRPHNHGW